MTNVFCSRMMYRWCAALTLAATVTARSAHAQPQAVSAGVTSAINRARALVDGGEGTKARQLLDSLVDAAPRDSWDGGEALYWRALMSEEAAAAERDWKRIVVEIPFSPRASDALLRLAELDLMRSNQKLARQHVQQLLADHPEAPERPRALLILARSYFDDRDAPRACGVLTVVRKEAPLSAVEVRLQADELQQQCRNVREVALGATPDSTNTLPATVAAAGSLATQTSTLPVTPPRGAASSAAGKSDSAKRTEALRAGLLRDSIVRDSVLRVAAARDSATRNSARDSATRNSARDSAPAAAPKRATPAAAPAPTGKWTVQVAAYDTRAQADALVKRLAAKKMDAHTAGTKKPFRVQVGRYATRAEANAALAALKKKGQKGFVAEVTPK